MPALGQPLMPASLPTLQGSCLCGAVRYEVTGPLGGIEHCHCTMCRKAHGAAFSTNVVVPTAGFQVTAGEGLIAGYESSPHRRKCFCARCGSPLFIRRSNAPDAMAITLGTIDSELPKLPERHVFVGSRASWHAITDALPQFKVYPGFEPPPSATIQIRPYRPGDEAALFEVYHSAIHLIASQDYTPEQVQAWAPEDLDMHLWEGRIRGIDPFVAELDGEVVGYADLQANGYIDHFFVSGHHPRLGIGTQLMQHLVREARARQLTELTSDVSRTAQPFYARFGFVVVEQREPVLRGVVIPNALMQLVLT